MVGKEGGWRLGFSRLHAGVGRWDVSRVIIESIPFSLRELDFQPQSYPQEYLEFPGIFLHGVEYSASYIKISCLSGLRRAISLPFVKLLLHEQT